MTDHVQDLTIRAVENRAPATGINLFGPGDAGYTAAMPWNRAVSSRPCGVVRAESASEVAAAVRYARNAGLRAAVRCTGHGALPIDPSVLLIHTGAMTECTVDPAGRWARIGAGTRWRQVIDEAAPHGLAPVCGAAPEIGAVGYLTGGGIGPMARTFGVSSDYVRGMEVVTGEGRILRATPQQNEDLFWGLRGGKATLGIVTSVDVDLVDAAEFYGGSLWFAAADTRRVLTAWARWCLDLPEAATSSAAIMRLPPLEVIPAAIAGRQSVAIRFAWVGDPRDGERHLADLRQAAVPVLDDVRLRPCSAVGEVHGDPVAPMSTTQQSALLSELPDPAVERLVDAVGEQGNRQNAVELRHLRGAISQQPLQASAVCHRNAGFSLFVAGPAMPNVDEHATGILGALTPWTMDALLPNFAASDDPADLRRHYDENTLHRLVTLGDRYDPAHVLHTGQVARTRFGAAQS